MLNTPGYTNKKGFSLVELVISIGIFALFALGIYGGIQFVFKVVYNSRIRIIETAILNEQVEILHNLAFSDVGIVAGNPVGLLVRTETITRNNIPFTITRTVRNIDDSFDGTIGGNPNDTSPADYKLVELEIICDNCRQNTPTRLSTRVAPKYLEGNPDNGALFIQVFDAAAVPVQGADVHIVASSVTPPIDLMDTTDKDGMLRLVDTPPGVEAYDITVSKTGFTNDNTTQSSPAILSPIKPPASVVAQGVTAIGFAVDLVSSISVGTVNSFCSNLGSVPVNFRGTKLIASDPVYLEDQDIVTDVNGNHTFGNLVWDAYNIIPTGYDLLGSIPALPVSIGPNVSQNVKLVLGVNTTNSLLVNVLDSITSLPVSDATVVLSATGFTETKDTGLGFVNQTDWSGNSGQYSMSIETKYWSDNGKIDNSNPTGDLVLRTVGINYINNGELESSVFDLGLSVNFVNLAILPQSQPVETGVDSLRFQIATSNLESPSSWDYLGPDGTASTYYTASTPTINTVHNGSRYFRYKAFLTTEDIRFTPTLSDISVTYINSCTPPGQAYFGSLGSQTYTIDITKTGYQPLNQTVDVTGDTNLNINFVVQ
jgi:prepilin-type N-terminal cleavage/methylation domain-containing protein